MRRRSTFCASGGNYLHSRIADVTTTHLGFPSGLQAHIFVSWLHPFKEQKLVVVGDHKMAVFDDTQPWEDKLLLYPHQIHWQNNMPVPTKAEPERVEIPQTNLCVLECQHFLDAWPRGKPRSPTGEEGSGPRVLDAAQQVPGQQGTRCRCRFAAGRTARLPLTPAGVLRPPQRHCRRGGRDRSGNQNLAFQPRPGRHRKSAESCNIGQNVVIGPDVTIGNGCKIQNNVSSTRA